MQTGPNCCIISNRAPDENDKTDFRIWIDTGVSPWVVYTNWGIKWVRN